MVKHGTEVHVKLKEGVTLKLTREEEPPRWGWPQGWTVPHWKLWIPFGHRPISGKRERPKHICIRILDSSFDRLFEIVEEE